MLKKNFLKLFCLTQNGYCSRFIQRPENLVYNYGNDNNLGTNRTVYASRVFTFVVHFVKLMVDFYANM